MVNVIDFGALPDGKSDSSDAFEAAIESGKCIYVPEGYYRISRTINLYNCNLVGDGIRSTVIEMTSAERNSVIINAGGQCVISDLTLQFADGIIDGTEQRGERVGILTGCNGHPLMFGSSVRNLRINETGTALYSAAENGSESFSVTYDTIDISGFSFRGVDFAAKNRTGNIYRNLYIHSHYEVDTLFCLDTEESEADISQLNVEHTRCKYGISLTGVRALAASTIHIEGLIWSGAAVRLEESSGSIGALSVYYSAIEQSGVSLIEIGNGIYNIHQDWAWAFPETMRYMRIGTLHLKGLNDPNKDIYGRYRYGLTEPQTKDFSFFKRTESSAGDYTVKIDNYAYYTFQQDADVYENLAVIGNVNVLR